MPFFHTASNIKALKEFIWFGLQKIALVIPRFCFKGLRPAWHNERRLVEQKLKAVVTYFVFTFAILSWGLFLDCHPFRCSVWNQAVWNEKTAFCQATAKCIFSFTIFLTACVTSIYRWVSPWVVQPACDKEPSEHVLMEIPSLIVWLISSACIFSQCSFKRTLVYIMSVLKFLYWIKC